MRIIHVATYKDGFFNGIMSVLANLVPAQRQLGHDVIVLNQEYNEKPVISEERYVNSRGDFIDAVEHFNPDIVILHSLYSINDVKFSWYLKKRKIPYLIEPHGGTSQDNAKKNKLKKKIANIVYANRFIHNAAGLVYLNEKEANDCVFKRHRRNYVVIPNGTQMHGRPTEYLRKDGKIRFMFLARIDIIQKGLDLLFPAIKQFNADGYKEKAEFHFYGKARNPKWATTFNQYISEADDNVFFHGPVDGETKELAYQNADVFLLTSRYEGMPMSILEALSYGLPCIITPQTNVENLITKGRCGWVTNANTYEITQLLKYVSEDYSKHICEYVENALKAVEPFAWDRISKYSIECYKSIIQKEI